MFKETNKKFKFGTDVLSKGIYIDKPATNPEATPIYMTTAFNVEDLDDLQKRYDEHGFCYNRINDLCRKWRGFHCMQFRNGCYFYNVDF